MTNNAWITGLRKNTNLTKTENGAVANATTNSSLLDLFGQIGAFRTGNGAKNRIAQFYRAFGEDRLLALKCLFWARDIREGAGERETFRILLHDLAIKHPDVVLKNLSLIPEFGRWDDLWGLLNTSLKNDVIALVKNQLKTDATSKTPSLLAKWLPSENTSSKETRKLATTIREAIGFSPRDYRKLLSLLRTQINVLEKKMSARQWSDINYEHVPSQASMRYRKAFKKHDETRYSAYLEAVKKGEKKINSKALFPYEIVDKFLTGKVAGDDATLEALWSNLPNYFGDHYDDSLVVADVSGSMAGIPLSISISLALYMAEKNTGCWNNKFITFSNNPQFNEVRGATLRDKIYNLNRAEWQMSTNIEAVFKLILNTAIQNKLSNDQMLKRVFIISDFEFNAATGINNPSTLFRSISTKFSNAGYTIPTLVFWNVRAVKEQYPMSLDDTNWQLVSGSSPSILQYMFTGSSTNPYSKMLEVLNSERYIKIVI